MSTSVAFRQDPWTVDDLVDLPEDGQRYEVLEGALIVSPAPELWHQLVADRLQTVLERAAPPGVHVVTASTIAFGQGETAFIPDVVVTDADLTRRPVLLLPEHVLAAVEVVSPSSRSRDRVLKPDRYAAFAIPCYWRVELDPFPAQGDDALPVIVVHELLEGRLVEIQRVAAGTSGTVRAPYAVTVDPADLTP